MHGYLQLWYIMVIENYSNGYQTYFLDVSRDDSNDTYERSIVSLFLVIIRTVVVLSHVTISCIEQDLRATGGGVEEERAAQ